MSHDAQLGILADALTRIIDIVAGQTNNQKLGNSSSELLERVGDVAAEALAAAATFGLLPSVAGPPEFAAPTNDAEHCDGEGRRG